MAEGVIHWAEITLGRRLGEGGFGIVYQAKRRHDDVAVKKIKEELLLQNAEAARAEFRKELATLRSLVHRNIVQCYGGDASESNDFFIVTELMERGSLDDCLRKHKDEFAWDRLGKKVLLDAAKGLLYLHDVKLWYKWVY